MSSTRSHGSKAHRMHSPACSLAGSAGRKHSEPMHRHAKPRNFFRPWVLQPDVPHFSLAVSDLLVGPKGETLVFLCSLVATAAKETMFEKPCLRSTQMRMGQNCRFIWEGHFCLPETRGTHYRRCPLTVRLKIDGTGLDGVYSIYRGHLCLHNATKQSISFLRQVTLTVAQILVLSNRAGYSSWVIQSWDIATEVPHSVVRGNPPHGGWLRIPLLAPPKTPNGMHRFP